MCSKEAVVVDVPAPDEPVTAIIGFRDDMGIASIRKYLAILYGEFKRRSSY
jgi:hypothetical protein